MCSAVEVGDLIIAFNEAEARLPVLGRHGDLHWLRWGESHGVTGSPWVAGPCARLDSIQAGKWDKYAPVPVKLAVGRYMERNASGKPYWGKLAEGEYLQGLVAVIGRERRVYVVTVDTPPRWRHVSLRWPRIVGGTNQLTSI